jgi:hypothetical protein
MIRIERPAALVAAPHFRKLPAKLLAARFSVVAGLAQRPQLSERRVWVGLDPGDMVNCGRRLDPALI